MTYRDRLPSAAEAGSSARQGVRLYRSVRTVASAIIGTLALWIVDAGTNGVWGNAGALRSSRGVAAFLSEGGRWNPFFLGHERALPKSRSAQHEKLAPKSAEPTVSATLGASGCLEGGDSAGACLSNSATFTDSTTDSMQAAFEALRAEAAAAGVSLQSVWKLLDLRNAPFLFPPTEEDVPASTGGKLGWRSAVPRCATSRAATASARKRETGNSLKATPADGEESPSLQEMRPGLLFPSDLQTLRLHSLLTEPVSNASPDLRRRRALRKASRLEYLARRRAIDARAALRGRFSCTFFSPEEGPFSVYDPWARKVEREKKERERVALQAQKLRRVKRWWVPRNTIQTRIARRRARAEALKAEAKKLHLKEKEKMEVHTKADSDEEQSLTRAQKEQIVRMRLRYQQEMLLGKAPTDPRTEEEEKAEVFYVKKSVDLADAHEGLLRECGEESLICCRSSRLVFALKPVCTA